MQQTARIGFMLAALLFTACQSMSDVKPGDGRKATITGKTYDQIWDAAFCTQANARRAVLLTADKDFGELVFRQGLVHSGVVLLRLAGLANATKAEIVAEVCRDRAAELFGAFMSSSRLARSVFDERRDQPGGPNFGMQPTAFGRG